jgi:hypothetical protein
MQQDDDPSVSQRTIGRGSGRYFGNRVRFIVLMFIVIVVIAAIEGKL